MIGWLQPWALWGLGLVALPMAVHLLQRREAKRLPFPSTRFIRTSRTAAVRLRPPSDVVLLLLRMAIVAFAALAAAQPVWISASRIEAWNARTARAIVVDSSPSMRSPRADGRSPSEDAAAAAAAENRAEFTYRIDALDMREGIRRAAAFLERTPPARREIVVVSDFQLGALTLQSLDSIDQTIGLRFVRVGGEREEASIAGAALLHGTADGRATQRVRLSAGGTQLRIAPGPAEPLRGFRVLGAANPADERRLLETLALAGTPAPEASQPIAVAFAGTVPPDGATPRFDRWMIGTLAGLERDAELVRLTRHVTAKSIAAGDAWAVLLKDREGNPLLRAASLDGELVLHVAAPSSSYFAAAVARAALIAREGLPARPEHEVLTIPAETLSAWSRPPGPAPANGWRNADISDARWLWSGALLLLAVEHRLRSRTIARKDEARAAA